MDINRRQLVAAAAITALATACGLSRFAQRSVAATSASPPDEDTLSLNADNKKKDNKAHLATEPFLIGPTRQYLNPGLYAAYKEQKGVWIISDGRALVALSATCTHLACTTRWEPDNNLFKCPCHKSRFSPEGINQEGSKAKRPLERCTLTMKDTPQGPQILVDPTRRLRQEKGEWSHPQASISLH
jgi:Rieske Fe-S protein